MNKLKITHLFRLDNDAMIYINRKAESDEWNYLAKIAYEMFVIKYRQEPEAVCLMGICE